MIHLTRNRSCVQFSDSQSRFTIWILNLIDSRDTEILGSPQHKSLSILIVVNYHVWHYFGCSDRQLRVAVMHMILADHCNRFYSGRFGKIVGHMLFLTACILPMFLWAGGTSPAFSSLQECVWYVKAEFSSYHHFIRCPNIVLAASHIAILLRVFC